ncbi:MAG: hypothetical protein NZ529_08685 [Cytophagaceae bacterium]|nr:hypothetical protein [Cytophagaceae bacterium]MDW8456858.1 hypothetical protein [Cytophagaceae bacterium]
MQQLHFTREQVIKILEDYSIQTGIGLDVPFRHFPKGTVVVIRGACREECIEASASER